MSHTWLDGVMGILKRFQDEGAPSPALTDWSGRWWSVFGAIDMVPMGEKVLLASPEMPNPFFKVAELTVTERDEARIREAGAFASYGEPVRLVRTDDGVVAQVLIGGFRTVTEAALAKEVNHRYKL
jgi:D-alanyl-D-alanine carboxypeptidase